MGFLNSKGSIMGIRPIATNRASCRSWTGEDEKMSYDGIWTVQIAGPLGWRNVGILVMDGGRAVAGNDNFYARGSYSVSDTLIRMTLAVWFYGTSPTIAGTGGQAFTIEFQGNLTPHFVSGTLSRPDKTNFTMRTRLTRRADLPMGESSVAVWEPQPTAAA